MIPAQGETRMTAPRSLAVPRILAVLERVTERPRAIWTWIAAVFLIMSLAGPLTMGTTGAAKASLAALHVVTAAVLIVLLPRRRTR